MCERGFRQCVETLELLQSEGFAEINQNDETELIHFAYKYLPQITGVHSEKINDSIERYSFECNDIDYKIKYYSLATISPDETAEMGAIVPHMLVNAYTFKVLKLIYPNEEDKKVLNLLINYALQQTSTTCGCASNALDEESNVGHMILKLLKTPQHLVIFFSKLRTQFVWSLLEFILTQYKPAVKFTIYNICATEIREYRPNVEIIQNLVFYSKYDELYVCSIK